MFVGVWVVNYASRASFTMRLPLVLGSMMSANERTSIVLLEEHLAIIRIDIVEDDFVVGFCVAAVHITFWHKLSVSQYV